MPMALGDNVNPIANSRQRNGRGMIFCSFIVYVGSLFSLHFLCIVNRVYGSLNNYSNVEYKI